MLYCGSLIVDSSGYNAFGEHHTSVEFENNWINRGYRRGNKKWTIQRNCNTITANIFGKNLTLRKLSSYKNSRIQTHLKITRLVHLFNVRYP